MDSHDKLARAAALMDRALCEATGLNEFARKLVIYWTLSTHALKHLDTYPILALLGRMGCGKSQTLNVIANFARLPVRISLRGTTLPMLRDRLISARDSTAIIEEADHAWHDSDSTFERLFSDRYSRASAEAALKIQIEGEKGMRWQGASAKFFGATVLHRRIGFKDAALDGRSVSVQFRADTSRRYREFRADDAWNVEGRELLINFEFEPIDVAQQEGVAGRTFSTYKPLMSVAKLCVDDEFLDQLCSRLLLQESLALKEAQASEPDGLVLQAIVEQVLPVAYEPQFTNIRLGDLADTVWKNHKVLLSPLQIGRIARDLGFETKVSHGMTVVVPTPAAVLRACDECNYSDEAIDKLRSDVLPDKRAT